MFNQKPHPIASLAYDAVGLVISLNENKKPINASSLTRKNGFIGINGTFKLYLNGNIERNPSIYKVKNEKIYKVNN